MRIRRRVTDYKQGREHAGQNTLEGTDGSVGHGCWGGRMKASGGRPRIQGGFGSGKEQSRTTDSAVSLRSGISLSSRIRKVS